MNTKGITPLMTTILLISFAVAVGVVIMNFGRASVEEESECSVDPQIQLSNITGKLQICYDFVGKALTFTVENGAVSPVQGLVVNVIGTEKAHTFEINDAKMPRAGSYIAKLQYDFAVGKAIRQVKITPKIRLQDKEEICVDKAVIVEDIKGC